FEPCKMNRTSINVEITHVYCQSDAYAVCDKPFVTVGRRKGRKYLSNFFNAVPSAGSRGKVLRLVASFEIRS
ncbi:hypothetical protein GBA52_008578, partial [Prunus armeniaca]